MSCFYEQINGDGDGDILSIITLENQNALS